MADGSLVPDILNPDAGLHESISGQRGGEGPREVLDATQLSWNWTINGPETTFDQVTKGPKEGSGVKPESQAAENPGCVVMRAERQTLRRMPRSGAILFTIRYVPPALSAPARPKRSHAFGSTYLTPVEQMANEPGVPGRLAHAMRAWPAEVARSKGGDLYLPVVLPYLDAKHQSQLESGVIKDVETEMQRSRTSFPM